MIERLRFDTRGLSLIEVVVAAAILAVVSLLLVTFIYTAAGLTKRSAEIANSDEELTNAAATDPDSATSTGETLELGGFSIDATMNTFSTNDGSLSTFEYTIPEP
ncbi:MAG: prepilin-type N-terminal cleavage/methylation domain-containing protein [Coriobacteriales bacterium]|jgi:prepilin-type N-terminal cleavage/methylation domain-containing protein|nr:prepilin-type N-terminal cleavage/methylation domain-containing protein [Coriobacteriales bacterium]